MHNCNRWAPFSPVIDGEDAITEILKQKNRLAKPILSEEMLENIEESIINSYKNKITIKLKHYNNGQIKEITGIITKLDSINKKIILDNTISLYFSNIVEILEKST